MLLLYLSPTLPNEITATPGFWGNQQFIQSCTPTNGHAVSDDSFVFSNSSGPQTALNSNIVTNRLKYSTEYIHNHRTAL